MMNPRRNLAAVYSRHLSFLHVIRRCRVVYIGVDVGVSTNLECRLVGRSVWTRARPQGSRIVYWAPMIFLNRLRARVWLKSSASTIVYTLRVHWRRAVETFFQALRMSRYMFMSWGGRRQFNASSSSGVVVACVVA